MPSKLRYDWFVRRLIPASAALVAMLMGPALQAQIHGVPPSVTSLGGSKTTFNPPGVPASVTSLGPNGFQPNFPTCCINPLFPLNPNPPLFRHRWHFPFFPVVVPVYTSAYTPVVIVQPGVDDSMEEEEYGGPTIFDRRGPGRRERAYDRYAERERRREREEAAEPAPKPQPEAASTPAAELPATVLVFRDGHRAEVKNYAIVGDTLYDFTSAPRRKIALAELDVAATVKQNDERGVDFRLPAPPNPN